MLKKRANFQDLSPRNSICCILTVDLNQLSKGRFTEHFIIKMKNVISYSSSILKPILAKNWRGLKTPLSPFSQRLSHILDFNKFH